MKFLAFAAVAILLAFVIPHAASWWRWYGTEAVSNGVIVYPHTAIVNPVVAAIGAALLIGAAILQAWTATRRHVEQTNADRERRITESYSKAVEQLGSDKIEVRLGGIYTLERISRESPDDYWTVMETLCAFVRERAQWKEPGVASSEMAARPYEAPPRSEPSTYIAAVLAVLNRRPEASREREEIEGWCLDLRATDLRGANLIMAKLSRAILSRADLSEANLTGADLSGAYLTGVDLSGVHLMGTNVSGAILTGADLSGVVVATFGGANFSRAYLSGANLRGADFRWAFRLSEEQLVQADGDARTRLPLGMTRPAHWPPEEPEADGETDAVAS